MLDYEKLRTASDWADLSPSLNIEDWAKDEEINAEELMDFASEEAIKMAAWGLGSTSSLAFGIIFGVRIANLVQRTENTDPSTLLPS